MTERGELDFSGRTALVTGAGRNIGRAIVLEFARRGATVVVHTGSDRAQADAVAKEARELGADALVVVADLTEDGAVDTVAAQALERFGRVDISVSNAARRLYKSFDETTDADWHLHLNMQLTASWYLAKAFVQPVGESDSRLLLFEPAAKVRGHLQCSFLFLENVFD